MSKEASRDLSSGDVSKTYVRKGLLAGVWHDFRHGFLHYLGYDILVKLFAVAVLAPLSTWVVTRLISTTGHLSVGNEQIASFLLSPAGLVAVFVASTVAFWASFLAVAGVVVMGTRARAGQRVYILEAVRVSIKRLLSLLGLGALQAGLYFVALAPLAVLAWLGFLFLAAHYDINYLISERPSAFWVAAAVASLLLIAGGVVAARLYLRWIFTLPAVMLERCGPIAALQRGASLMSGAYTRVGVVLLAWAFVSVVAPVLATAVFDGAGVLLLPRLGDSVELLIVGTAILVLAYSATIGVMAFVGLSVNGLLIVRLYHDVVRHKGEVETRLSEPSREFHTHITWPKRKWMVIGAIAALVVAAIVQTSLAVLQTMKLDHQVVVTAHRGSSTRAPENSLSAIEMAIEDGADYAEIDVQETADGVIVLLHDTDLLRIAGLNRKIWEVTYDEIRELDAGSWFSAEFAQERVPTLEQAIEVARGRIGLQIELKFNGYDEMLGERVVRIVEEAGFGAESQIVSLELEALGRVKRLNPSLETGFIVARAVGNLGRLDVDFLSVNRSIADESLVRSVQGAGKELHVWTVNDRRVMSSLIDLGVDGILTDDPALLRSVIEERAQLNEVEKVMLAFHNWLNR